MMTNTRLNQKGFSLVEVLVAIFIIAMGVILFGYFAKSLKTTSDARIETEAMISLRSALDDTRALWSSSEGYSAIEFPYLVTAPKSYTNLTVYVKSLQATNAVSDYACTYTFLPNLQKFENNCPILNTRDEATLLRHIEFTLSTDQKEPLVLSMELARPIK